eukprot:TRINITY_DN15206_c0_g1_i1.p2 TRINITY_DN15206_c0_g1~~TRINITY_DN15206_c0_g1_i1.p2  ORF type:complete len:170 (+),score=79.06 TRINITY_DN15206_c0_g1_i1:107-616(+)
MFAAVKAGAAEEAIPKAVEESFYAAGQRDRYLLTERWAALKEKGQGSVATQDLVKWCEEVRAAAAKEKKKVPKQPAKGPASKRAAKKRSSALDDDASWWPFLLGVCLPVAYVALGVYLLLTDTLREEHFNYRWWTHAYSTFSWRHHLPAWFFASDAARLDEFGQYHPDL